MVRVQDKEIGEDVTFRVLNVRKRDALGAPGDVEIEIANRPQDIAGSIADLRNRQYANEVYAQGATNLDSRDFADNCDPDHPAIIKLYIPEETARINKLQLTYQVEAFRSYERAIESAPATTSGPSSTSTTAAGGQTTSGPSSTSTTAAGGQTTSGPSSTSTTAAGGSSSPTSNVQVLKPGLSQDFTDYQANHDHGIDAGTVLVDKDGGWHTWVPSGGHDHLLYNHGHIVDIPDHVHGMDHTHEIAAHTHGMDHTHQIAAHTHGMDHTHTIPAHTHDIEYGIFEGPTPTAVTIEVDGNVVPGLDTSAQDVDIIPYLAKDSAGKVQRGWHEIKITPNSLGRIVACVNSQIFVQSRGGGDY